MRLLLLAIYASSLACHGPSEGWIYNKYIQLHSSITQLQPTSSHGLIISSDQSLFTTKFSTPDKTRESIFEHFNEETQFTYNPISSQLIYMNENTLHFVSIGSHQYLPIEQITSYAHIIKNGTKIYFFDVFQDTHIYEYDIKTATLTKGD